MDQAPASSRDLQSIGRVAGTPYAARDCARIGVGYGVDRHNIVDEQVEEALRSDRFMRRVIVPVCVALTVLAMLGLRLFR